MGFSKIRVEKCLLNLVILKSLMILVKVVFIELWRNVWDISGIFERELEIKVRS